MWWLKLIGNFLDKVPIQGRKERWKNQIDELKKERRLLLKGRWNEKKGKRIYDIDVRLDKLNQLCKNVAQD